MNRYARALCALYLAVFAWLAFCTVNTWNSVPLWSSTVMALGSIAVIVAGFREAEHADDLRGLCVELERAARLTLQPPADPQPVAERGVMSLEEQVMFDEIAAHYRKDEAA